MPSLRLIPAALQFDDPASDDDDATSSASISVSDDSQLPPRRRRHFRTRSPVPARSQDLSDEGRAEPPSSDDGIIHTVTPVRVVYPSGPPRTIRPTFVGAGLENEHSNCFVNAILQCLTHTVPLVQRLRSWDHKIPCTGDKDTSFCALCFLRRHIEAACNKRFESLNPQELINNLQQISSDFAPDKQADAHEFYGALVNKLDACCLVDNRDDESSHPRTIVDEVFRGKQISKAGCCDCEKYTITDNQGFLDMSLGIEHDESLIASLESFTKMEKMPEAQYNCENCNKKVPLGKQLLVGKEPTIVAFHLKRYEYDRDETSVKKIDKHVSFPLELNLRPFTHDRGSDVELKYQLYGVVVHIGDSPNMGHYFCFIRSFPEVWHKFNDKMVSRVTEDFVLQQNAYILFYAKDGTPWFSSWMEDNPVSEASPDSVLEKFDNSRVHQFSQVATEHDYPSGTVESIFYDLLQKGRAELPSHTIVPPISMSYPDYRPHTIKPAKVGAGLINVGFHCFVNAILQCITHTVPFVQSIRSWDHKSPCHGDEYSDFCPLCYLRVHFENSFNSTGTPISAERLISSLRHISSDFQERRQQDAHEFYVAFLNKLESCYSDENRDDKSSPPKSIVREVFGGSLLRRAECCSCKEHTVHHESFNNLILDIGDAASLIDALKSYFKLENVDDWNCEECNKKVSLEKWLHVEKEPTIAVFYLNRLNTDGASIKKIDAYVEFPSELDLRPFTSGLGSDVELQYELYGVVVHEGNLTTEGHYIGFIQSFPGVWHEFDDHKVSEVLSEEGVLCQDAYMLFYAKKGTPWFSSLMDERERTAKGDPISGGKDADEAVYDPDSSYKHESQMARERKKRRIETTQNWLNQLRKEDPRRKQARRYLQVIPRSRVKLLHNAMFARLDPKKITVLQ